MITELCFIQGTPIKVTPDDDGKVEIPVGEEGTTIVITFTPSNPDKPIFVHPVEVTACAEPGMYLLLISINPKIYCCLFTMTNDHHY